MADDWDSIDTDTPVAAVVNQWEGEDEDDDQAPDAWDAEPEEKPKKDASGVAPPEKKKAITKRALQKKEEEERRLAEKMAAAQMNDPSYQALQKEKLRQMELDRDAALAGDLFGAESIKPKEATSDLPKPASTVAASTVAASSSSSSNPVPDNSSLKGGARIEDIALETDADVDRFISELGKRLEKLGKSALASKKITKIIAGIMDETVKLGVLRMDDVGELKRLTTVKHNDMNAKLKKNDKKGKPQQAAKPVVALARNAFMHGDNFGSHADENPDDYDFI